MNRFQQTMICVVLFFFSLLIFSVDSPAAAAAENVYIYTSPQAAAPVVHGVKHLRGVLQRSGYNVADAAQSLATPAEPTIAVGDISQDAELKKFLEQTAIKAPSAAEAFTVGAAQSKGATVIVGAGGDAVGAMYAAYEIAEQIELSGSGAPLQKAIRQKTETPFMEIRAVNPFFHVQAFEDRDSWYFSEDFWASYLDWLSYSRYNLLDIHAMYDLYITSFPNAYLYLLKSDRYPDIGVPADVAKVNLDVFNRIISMAKDRGIRTSLMSYHAGWSLTGHGEGPRPPTDEELADYTREMVRDIINKCPDLWMVGFRIGESGRPADFFRKSYIAGIKEADRPIYLFTRTWVTQPVYVREIADSYPGKTFIEIKYNGEQLGLPYHAITSPRAHGGAAPSYTFEDYTNYPRNYKILWQIRANGTHRLFRWGDPVFAARAMRSTRFGEGIGFTMEPLTSYYPMTDFFHNFDIDHEFFTWDHERNWFWYFVWGRTAYNPDTPEDVWLLEFGKRYGAAAPAVYHALTTASKIVPLIYSYRCLGLDHRQMAPEYENGGTLDEFTTNLPLDINVMRPIDEFVRHSLFRSPILGAKMGPFEVAGRLEKYIDDSAAAVKEAAAALGADDKDFNCLRMEIESLSHLASYYANKLRAAVHLEFFRETMSAEDLHQAKEYTAKALDDWEQLSVAGEKHYRPLLDTLRMHTREFTWRKEGEELEADKKIISNEEKGFMSKVSGAKSPMIAHRPVYFWHETGRAVPVSATVIGGEPKELNLFFRKAGSGEFQSVGFSKSALPYVYTAEIPPQGGTAAVEYYIEGDINGTKSRFPSERGLVRTLKTKFSIEEYADGTAKYITEERERMKKMMSGKYVTLLITDDDQPPRIRIQQPQIKAGGTKAIISAAVEDEGGVKEVYLYYKALPSYAHWNQVAMKKDDGNYSLEVMLTPEGLMYYAAAADNNGNAAQAPDFRVETPYAVITAWEPSKNPHK
ncbi:MAG: hypothetical protein AB1546_06265 [bacterium]